MTVALRFRMLGALQEKVKNSRYRRGFPHESNDWLYIPNLKYCLLAVKSESLYHMIVLQLFCLAGVKIELCHFTFVNCFGSILSDKYNGLKVIVRTGKAPY